MVLKAKQTLMILITGVLLSACDGDATDAVSQLSGREEIRLHVAASDYQEAHAVTRAVTYTLDVLKEAAEGFRCYAFYDGSTKIFIGGSVVDYNEDRSRWAFHDGISGDIYYYWPAEETIHFFAYAPHDIAESGCSFDAQPYDAEAHPDGYSDGVPRVVCTGLPVTITKGDYGAKELLLAYTPDQTREANGYSGVSLAFKHTMTSLYFTLDATSGTAVTVNSVTIKNIKNHGSCTFDGSAATWAVTGADADLTVSGSPVLSSASSSDGPYLVLPQTFAGVVTFEVNATWSEWGQDITKTVSTTVNIGAWQPSTKYTYNLKLSKYAITVSTQKYTEQW